MPEPIHIRIDTSYDGRGAKEAIEDKEKLEGKGKSGLATPPPNIDAPPPPSRQEAAQARREAAQRNKALIADAEEDLARAKATGASTGKISELESQLREQKLKARFMREQNLPEDAAAEKAQNLVNLQNEAKARREEEKKSRAEKAQAEKAASADQTRSEKAAAAEKRQEEKRGAAEAKAAAIAAKKEAAEEERKQAALAKGREGFLKRAARAGSTVIEDAAGSTPFAGPLNAVGSLGGAGGIAIAAVVAATLGVVGAFAKQRDAQDIINMEGRAQTNAQARRLRRMGGVDGTAESNRQAEIDFAEDAQARIDQRGIIEKRSQFKWYNPMGWIDKMTGASENEKTENELAISRDLKGQRQAQLQKRQKYSEQVAPLVEAQKKLNEFKGNEARALQDQVAMIQEYDRLSKSGATPEEAAEGARVKMTTIARERAGNYSRLVTARDGAADTARVATAAHDEVANAVNAMHSSMLQNHIDAVNTATRKNFVRP